jgi:purine-binding chemotaxis protein CheW
MRTPDVLRLPIAGIAAGGVTDAAEKAFLPMSNPSVSNSAPTQRTAHASFGQETSSAGSDNLVQFISFAIGDDQYGVDIMAVREIKEWTAITHLPKQPEYVRGVLNLRGVIVPIIDLRCRFGHGITEATPLHVIIIVQIGNQLVGLLADRVSDIISVDATKIKSVPKVAQSTRLDFLSGIVTAEKSMIALIELPHLVSQPGVAETQLSAH